MPSHVHLILCPRDTKGLSRAIGPAHKRWANFINSRGRWRGHLFDGRFASVRRSRTDCCSDQVNTGPVTLFRTKSSQFQSFVNL